MDDPEALIQAIERDARDAAGSTGRPVLVPRVLDAIRAVPRPAFMPAAGRTLGWRNHAAPIGHGQTISQPFIVALMTDLLDLRPGHRVLEIGTGSGYQAAVLAALGCAVFSVEIIPELASAARATLAAQGLAGAVRLRTGDGAAGWPEEAPFDGVLLTAAAPALPEGLLAQLRPGGRLVAPLGWDEDAQELVLFQKDRAGAVERSRVLPVAFVKLTGPQGFPAHGGTA